MSNFKVHKRILNNGLAVLVLENHAIPKVSSQLWYAVGSKDEKCREKGIAHFIEHMIFKGTEKLSESDINLITHKLSGTCNAFTSYDYTGYLFDFPSAVWQQALPIMADCMRNCTFKQQFLNSEVKAVIQELKMYNDDFGSTLIEKMISTIFLDHPYHHPIIGYKYDLWSLNRDSLVSFYQKHYIPNNATLVVVGDVKPEDVFEHAQKNFESIPADNSYKHEVFYHTPDLNGGSVTIYREIQKPLFIFAFVVPGLKARLDYVLDCLTWIVGAGKSSRLYKKLVEEENIASDVNCFVYDLFDHSVLFVQVDPYNAQSQEYIKSIISHEMVRLMQGEIGQEELVRAIKKTEMDFISLQENNQKIAYIIGKYYTALQDETYLENYLQIDQSTLKKHIETIAQHHLSPALMFTGAVLPVAQEDKKLLKSYQDISDAQDVKVLSAITRETAVENGLQVHSISKNYIQQDFNYPQPQKTILNNGLRLLYHHDPAISKIEIIFDFQGKYFYDPEDKQGLTMMLFDMLQEGTKSYSSIDLAHVLESRGMSLGSFPGLVTLSMLSSDFRNGLEVLKEIICSPRLPKESFEHVRNRLLADVEDFWDDPQQFIGQLVRENIYDHHPYHKNIFGTKQTLSAITYDDIKNWLSRMITPIGTRIVIVGDLSNYDVAQEIEHVFSSWSGAAVTPMEFPKLPEIQAHEVQYPIVRDQITLAFAGVSVSRKDPDFDKLLLFDQVFSGGVLGSMSSRLFELRERSGLFYTIGGSLIANADQQPGMIYIKTIVSPDRLEEAEKSIKEVITHAAESLTQLELDEAVQAVSSSLVDNFASMKKMGSTFLFMDTFDLAPEFFKNRYNQLSKITIKEVQEAVKRHLDLTKMVTLRVGRV
ncbi:MAG: insulinase family protein [Candidatus Babeliaceae bacterium]|nr:insulinase family protein [Candidatus Babeliaceae bacterium]